MTKKSLNAKKELHPEFKTPRRYFEIDERASSEDAQKIAEGVLQKIAEEIDINPDLSDLKFDQVKESILGKHVLFQQQHDGHSVSSAWIRVDIDPEGKVFNIQNDLIPTKTLTKSKRGIKAKITKEEAIEKALEAAGVSKAKAHETPVVEQVKYPVAGVPTLAWKVIVIRENPRGEWKIYIDANTGEKIENINLMKEARGLIFDPNPVVSLNDTTLEDNSSIPDGAYVEVELLGLNASGHLDGPFVSTSTTKKRVKVKDGKFLFKRNSRAFKEVMVYYHIDKVQRYIQELGFTNILNKPIKVNTDGTKEDNSFYSPTTKSLTFGTGGVDDAEDADIILHEYGHAIQDAQVNGFGTKPEGRAMGEGFGDYLAASFFAERKPERMRVCVGTWDAVAYSGDDPPSLRRLDSTKKYPKDMTGEEHDDGEIWSACLWEIRKAMGGRAADKLILAHHFLLTPLSSFEDAAQALITTDQQLNQGRNVQIIQNVFVKRGILPNPKRRNRRAGVRFRDTNGGQNP